MGGFLSALSALAPIAPAQAQAHEIRRQRGMEDTAFRQDQADRQQMARLREQEIAQARQKTRSGDQPVIFGNPEWDPTQGAWTALAIDPKKGLTRVPVPGGENPLAGKSRAYKESREAYKHVTGHDPSPEMDNALFASSYGVKLPTSFGKMGQRFTDPATGLQWERVMGEDGVEHVEPIMGPDRQQLGGLKPPTVTDSNRMELKQDQNGNWVEIPVSTHTVRRPAGATPTVGGLPTSGSATPQKGPGGPSGVRPTGVHGKLSSQDAGLMESSQQIQDAAGRVMDYLAKARMQDKNGFMDKANSAVHWFTYKFGFSPNDTLMEDIALLSGIGASQWSRVGRGKYLFEKIQQHLPQPTDTPKLLYEKSNWLANNVSKETQRVVMQPVPNSMSPSQSGKTGDSAVDQFLLSVGGK